MKSWTTILILVTVACVSVQGRGRGQEKVTLVTPVKVDAGATIFRVAGLYLSVERKLMEVEFAEADGIGAFVPNGKRLKCTYDGSTAATLIIALNKADLSTKSLERRVIEQCQADGQLGTGVVSGTPQ